MAIDKAIDSAALHADLKGIADSIRAKGGTSAQFASAAVMKAAVDAIKTGNDTSDATATAADIMHNTTAYIASGKVTGAFTLDTELSAQDSKIAAIKEALKGKGSDGGGGSCGNWSKVEAETWTPATDLNVFTIPEDKRLNLDTFLIEASVPEEINATQSVYICYGDNGMWERGKAMLLGMYGATEDGRHSIKSFVRQSSNLYEIPAYAAKQPYKMGITYVISYCYK